MPTGVPLSPRPTHMGFVLQILTDILHAARGAARVRDAIMFSLTVEQLIVNLDVVAQILAS